MTAEDFVKSKEKATATFAGGCFWCMEPPFDAEPGVLETIVGYTGGSTENPIRYKFYRRGCRRNKRLSELWETN